MTQGNAAPVVAPNAGRIAVGDAQAAYRALVSQRDILRDQLGDAQRMRENLVSELAGPNQTSATKISLEKRIANVDERITELDKQIAASEKAVATAAAVPGATTRPPSAPRSGPPEEVYVLTGMFMFIVLLPMSIAFARRIWRRSAKATVVLPAALSERMASLERGVEAIALEVERIGEGQRFVTQVLSERADSRALGPGAAQPIPVRAADKIEERR